MTGAEFSEVDFDLLADYVGGALDGTPDEAVVTALIEGHPTWRAAYHRLTGGVAAVTAGLQSWGAEPEPMPADVLARLDSAFGFAAPGTASTADSAVGSVSSGASSPGASPAAASLSADVSAGAGASPHASDSFAATDASLTDASSAGAAVAGASPAGTPVAGAASAGAPVAGTSSVGSGSGVSGSVGDDSDVDVEAGAGAGLGAGSSGPVGATAGRDRMEPGSDGAAPARHLVAVPDDGERPATARKRTRRLKWAAPIGIAAGVLAFVGVGIQQLGTESSDQATSAAGSAADQGAPEAAGTLALPAGPAQVGASGVDYDQGSLREVAAQAVAAASGAKDRAPQSAESGGVQSRASTPGPGVMADPGDPLARLVPQEALLACIDAIAQANGAGPVTAEVVDYARFQGAPALVVQFTATNGTWVWAAGADCGLTGSGADRLGVVKVG